MINNSFWVEWFGLRIRDWIGIYNVDEGHDGLDTLGYMPRSITTNEKQGRSVQ